MPLDLVELIRASNNGVGGTAGQSFLNNVTGAGSGAGMQDYVISSWYYSGGIPLMPVEFTYSDNYLFSVTLNISRGSRFHNIQRLTSAAFNPFMAITGGTGGEGSSVTLESLSINNVPGATTMSFGLGLRVRAALTGSPNVSIGNSLWYDYGSFRTIRFFAAAIGGGGGVTTDYQLYVDYDPDLANFNSTIRNAQSGWPFRMSNRGYATGDLEYRWWLDEYQASINNGSAVYSTNSEFYIDVYPQFGQFTQYAYLRWRVPNGVWSNYTMTLYSAGGGNEF